MDKCRVETARNDHNRRAGSWGGRPHKDLPRPSCDSLARFLGRTVDGGYQTVF